MATVSAEPSPPADAAPRVSLVELHAQSLAQVSPSQATPPPSNGSETVMDLTALAPPPVRSKRKYTKRKRPGPNRPERVDIAALSEPPPPPPKRKYKTQFVPSLPPPKWMDRSQQYAFAAVYPKEYEQWKQERLEKYRASLVPAARERRMKRWLSQGTELPRHLVRELPRLPEVVRPEPEIAAQVEEIFVTPERKVCFCSSCSRFKFERVQPHEHYVCRLVGCHQTFHDLASFLEHQVDAHATVNVHCKRSRDEYYRSHPVKVFPPETVYIAFQYVHATEPPTKWTLEEVEREKEQLEDRLEALRMNSTVRSAPKRFIRRSFKVAYERIQRYGIAELNEQHRVALEHYESALVFPVGPRNRQDVISTVRVGRNWLFSVEPENSELTRMLKRDLGEQPDAVSENDSEDEEVVLWEIGGEDVGTYNHSTLPRSSSAEKSHSDKDVRPSKRPMSTSPVKPTNIHRAIDEPEVINL